MLFRKGISIVETVLAAILAVVILVAAYQVFFRFAGMTIKGEDTINSVRDVMMLFEDIRSEVMGASAIASPVAILTSGADEIDYSGTETETLIIKGLSGTLRYSVVEEADGRRFVEKAVLLGDDTVRSRRFGIDRLVGFTACWIVQSQAVGAGRFRSKSLYVIIELQGGIPGWPGTNVRFSSVFTPPFGAVENSTWPR